MFVAAPFGGSLDTFRLWESLFLGSIPVVRSSPMDILYKDFPIIIIPSWASVGQDSISSWQYQIMKRFGPEPFSAGLRRKLSMQYWFDIVRNASNRSSFALPGDAG